MKLNIFNPKQSLNKAYLKEKVSRDNIELFKKNLSKLIGKIDEHESEEHLKNVISEFLKDTWYKETNEINTKDRKDLVIHTGKTTKEPVGVILEVKKPSNKSEMMTEAKPNAKALHELILYYLRERVEHNNIDIKYLVVTNIYEWFIIDEVWFEKNVFRNNKLKKDFENWKLSGNDTKFFYDSIAKPFLETLGEKLDCTYFDLRAFEKVITNDDKKDDNKLIALYKLLSPVHLLKQPFANDSNTLDTKFYSELLHIIGLEEVNEGSKKLIKRKEKPDAASIMENTIMKLEDKDSLRSITNLLTFGSTKKDQLFNIALELSITWINRILFLKLLEAQLFKYHKGNEAYVFLNHKTIHDFDELSNLFFQVLAERPKSRREHLREKFKHVPYLNSSLFERTDLERQTFDISGLDNRLELPLISSTVLKNELAKRRVGKLTTLQYLFDFLDSYDFTSEGSEEIQEQNKNLINASVLGLIFEKINGYKDGSFFTPGFVTMYMCRETIRRSVVQKFNEQYKIDCESFDDLKNYVASKFKPKDILEFNKVINDLKICDPAVGSGHFLVSALNEIIAIKAELGILADREGLRLTGYEVKIENDELIVTYNDNTEIFEYTITSGSITKETQRLQKTLFHEKESIIENSLFGVDLNHNSVKICRLRLWIELLKNAYYTDESKFTELETLPNIDINIKCGNSLISRFPIDADLKKALKGKWNIETYKIAVHSYHEAENKEEKRKLEELIDTIKKDFRTEIGTNDPRRKKLSKLKEELYLLTVSPKLEFDIEIKKGGVKLEKEKVKKITDEITKIEQELKEIENSKIYESAFEWRFEFPEVLNNDGDFVGFDCVIGNPPYLNVELMDKRDKEYYKSRFSTFYKRSDIFNLFIDFASSSLTKSGIVNFIVPSIVLNNLSYKPIRERLLKNNWLSRVFYTGGNIFEEATVDTVILFIDKSGVSDIELVDALNFSNPKTTVVKSDFFEKFDNTISVSGDENSNKVFDKVLNATNINIEQYFEVFQGIVTGNNPVFIFDEPEQWKSIEIEKQLLKPLLHGRDFNKWIIKNTERKILYLSPKSEIDSYPKAKKYLEPFKKELSTRREVQNGAIPWYSLQWARNKNLLDQRPKIIIQNTRNERLKPRIVATVDEKGFYGSQGLNFVVPKGDEFSVYFLIGIINSTLINYLFATKFLNLAIKADYIKQVSFPKPTAKLTKDIETLSKEILAVKSIDISNDTSANEKAIDKLVYELYQLSKEEIKIIEG